MGNIGKPVLRILDLTGKMSIKNNNFFQLIYLKYREKYVIIVIMDKRYWHFTQNNRNMFTLAKYICIANISIIHTFLGFIKIEPISFT